MDSLCVVSCVVEGGVSDVSRQLTEMLTSRTTSERNVVVSPSSRPPRCMASITMHRLSTL